MSENTQLFPTHYSSWAQCYKLQNTVWDVQTARFEHRPRVPEYYTQ